MQRVRELVEQTVKDHIVSGVSLGLIEEGTQQFHYIGEQGVLSPYIGRPISEGLYYDLASLSKVVGTTTRMLQLLDEKKVTLDTEVVDILPRFSYKGITVGHLLYHNSGLPAEIRDKAEWSRENLLNYLYTTKPEWEPGEKFVYSDVGFILLGKIIETLDDMSLEETYQKHIFIPCGMEKTSFVTGKEKLNYVPTECTEARGCICGEVHDKKGFLLGPCGSAGLFSTLTDVASFVTLYLERSELLFGKEMFDMLLQQGQFERTLGWSQEYGVGTLYHTGFTGTSILMDMEKKKGMIVLANRIHPNRANEEFLERRKEWNRMFLQAIET